MESTCVRQTLIPGTSSILGDYLYHFNRVSSFYTFDFQSEGAFREAAAAISYPDERRAALVEALREQNGETPALAKLAEPGTVAVVTGQQVGLFSGPAYTVFKALTAVKLAQQLSEQGIPAVAVFWLATEDHDLAEIDHAWLFDQLGEPRQIKAEHTSSPGGPVGNVTMLDVPLSALRESLGELPFAAEVFAMVEKAYRPGATFGTAFTGLVREILKGFDLLYMDPLARGVREMGAPFLAEAVEQVPALIEALQQRDAELAAAGYHSQVHIDKDSSLVFVLDGGKRIALRWKDGRFLARDRSYTPGDLKGMSAQISPNALLRPVMQDYLLPTVSYVGGPAEIAYMAQAQVLYERLLGRMPVIFPRNGFTLLDARSTKLLDRYGLRIPDLLTTQDAVRGKIAATLVPPALQDQVGRLKSAVESSFAALQSDLLQFDPTLEAASAKSRAKILYQVEKLSRKTASESMRREERALTDANFLMNTVYPHRHLQERFYSIVPFLAKYGLDLPTRLMNEVQLLCPDHMVRSF